MKLTIEFSLIRLLIFPYRTYLHHPIQPHNDLALFRLHHPIPTLIHFNFEIFLDLQDLVLVKVKDTFYRGKVIEVFEDRSAVFFVDYGSVTLVHFKDIFFWHPGWDTTPG